MCGNFGRFYFAVALYLAYDAHIECLKPFRQILAKLSEDTACFIEIFRFYGNVILDSLNIVCRDKNNTTILYHIDIVEQKTIRIYL